MRKISDNKGFTLIEMIVVLVIIAIVSVVGAIGVVQYMNYSMYNKNCEYARTIFSTAQTALTNLKKNGGMDELQAELREELYENSNIAKTSDWYDESIQIKDEQGNDNGPRYYYLNSYNSASEDSVLGQTTKAALKDLIGKYIYDNDIWNHALSVEIDPYDGVVRRVWYCAQTLSFSRSEASVDITGEEFDKNKGSSCMYIGTGSSPADYSARRERKIGLYPAEEGNGSGTIPPDSELELDSPLGIEFRNSNILELVWEPEDIESEFSYIVSLSDESDNAATISIPYDSVNALTPDYTPQPVKIMDKDAKLLLKTDGVRIYALLDAADYGPRIVGDGTPINPGNDFSDASEDSFTTSAMRFTLPEYGGLSVADSIKASVAAANPSDNSAVSDPVSTDDENGTNLLFDATSLEDFYIITNFRHFNNIRFLREENTGQSMIMLLNNLDWNDENIVIYDSSDPEYTALHTADVDYSPITLRKGQTFDGDNHTILNINISKNKTRANQALLSQNDGTLKNIILQDPVIRGTQKVAAFVANNYGDLDNLTTTTLYSPDDESESGVIGTKYVGGIVASSGNGRLSNLTNSVAVKGCSYVGGIAGNIDNGESVKEDTAEEEYEFINCTDTGRVSFSEGDDAKKEYLGGMAGYANKVSFVHCVVSYNNPDVAEAYNSVITEKTSPEDFEKILDGDYVGGLAGKAVDCVFNNTDNDVAIDYIVGANNVGGYIGQLSRIRSESCNIESVTNVSTVIGKNAVGGIVGTNGLGELTSESNEYNMILYCINNSAVIATQSNAGGIVGDNYGTIVSSLTDLSAEESNADDFINNLKILSANAENIGGIAGKNSGSLVKTILNTDVYPIVYGNTNVGGVIGYAPESDIEDTFGAINVTGGHIYGNTNVGGAIGNCEKKGYINIAGAPVSIAPAEIKGKTNVGGLVGLAQNDSFCEVHNVSIGSNTSIKAETSAAGGLAGKISNADNNTINISSVDIQLSELTGASDIGGFIGEAEGITSVVSDAEGETAVKIGNGISGSPKGRIFGKVLDSSDPATDLFRFDFRDSSGTVSDTGK